MGAGKVGTLRINFVWGAVQPTPGGPPRLAATTTRSSASAASERDPRAADGVQLALLGRGRRRTSRPTESHWATSGVRRQAAAARTAPTAPSGRRTRHSQAAGHLLAVLERGQLAQLLVPEAEPEAVRGPTSASSRRHQGPETPRRRSCWPGCSGRRGQARNPAGPVPAGDLQAQGQAACSMPRRPPIREDAQRSPSRPSRTCGGSWPSTRTSARRCGSPRSAGPPAVRRPRWWSPLSGRQLSAEDLSADGRQPQAPARSPASSGTRGVMPPVASSGSITPGCSRRTSPEARLERLRRPHRWNALSSSWSADVTAIRSRRSRRLRARAPSSTRSPRRSRHLREDCGSAA